MIKILKYGKVPAPKIFDRGTAADSVEDVVAGIIEPLGNKEIANFISSISKSLTLLIALIIALAFVYFIMIGLVMCSANII